MNEAQQLQAGSLESLVAGVADEFLERQRRGERPDIEDYARRHPDAAGPIRDVLMSLQAIGAGLGPGGIAGEAPEPVTGILGDFRILREAGRGGMGIVYEAEQISLGRRVALKVLPFAATLDPRQLQRFKNEAQAAAQLHHTNIVPIHFVGMERGVHFYAMQFIDGQSLAEVIAQARAEGRGTRGEGREGRDDDRVETMIVPRPASIPVSEAHISTQVALGTEQTTDSPEFFRTVVRLGLQAAQALQHAHEVGIVHRDIKPGNLLLDERGNLWVTDFGLAHAQGDPKLTVTGDMVGTLRYMSPERTLGAPAVVDHRADIYALGATLYELLTLEPVFSGQQRLELLQQIARREPVPPRRLNPRVPLDLETIVLKALAKNPAERYPTAAELAADLQRFLDDKPIEARRPTLPQRAGRWLRRHAVLVQAAAVILVIAVLGLGISTALIWRSREETRTALDKAKRSEEETRTALDKVKRSQEETHAALGKAERSQQLAEAAVDDMYTQVAEQWLEEEAQNDPLQREFLLKALKYFKEFTQQSDGSSGASHKLALAFKRAGVIQHKFGQHVEARANIEAALRTYKDLSAASPKKALYRSELASCHNARAVVLFRTGKLRDAEGDYREACAINEALLTGTPLEAAPDNSALQHDLARYRVNLAALLTQAGRFDEADRQFSRALKIDTRLVAEHPDIIKYQLGLARTYSNHGILAWQAGRLEQAEKSWQEAVRLAEQLTAVDPRRRLHRELMVKAHGYLVALHHAAHRPQEAEKLLLENIPLRKRLVEDYPKRLEYEEDLAGDFYVLGLLQASRERTDLAEESYVQAAKLLRTLLARSPHAVRVRAQLASTCNNLANLRKDSGRNKEAIADYRAAIQLLEKQPEDCRREPLYRDELTIYLNNLGYVSWGSGRPQEAEPLLRRAIKLREELVKDFPKNAAYRDKLVGTVVNLGWVLKKSGKTADAEASFRGALKHATDMAAAFPTGEHQKMVANRHETLGRLLWDADRVAEGQEEFRAAGAAWRRALTLEPANPTICHLAARFFADRPEGDDVDQDASIELAEKALGLARKASPDLWITLGLVRYRAGDYQAAAAALAKAGAAKGEERCLHDFLSAMTCARLGKNRLARQHFDRAVSGMSGVWLTGDSLERRRREAEAVALSITGAR